MRGSPPRAAERNSGHSAVTDKQDKTWKSPRLAPCRATKSEAGTPSTLRDLREGASRPPFTAGPSNEFTVVFPRRKLGQTCRAGNQGPVVITLEMLSEYSHLPLSCVAKTLGISLTAMKKACRSVGVSRWPFRKSDECSDTASALTNDEVLTPPRVSEQQYIHPCMPDISNMPGQVPMFRQTIPKSHLGSAVVPDFLHSFAHNANMQYMMHEMQHVPSSSPGLSSHFASSYNSRNNNNINSALTPGLMHFLQRTHVGGSHGGMMAVEADMQRMTASRHNNNNNAQEGLLPHPIHGHVDNNNTPIRPIPKVSRAVPIGFSAGMACEGGQRHVGEHQGGAGSVVGVQQDRDGGGGGVAHATLRREGSMRKDDVYALHVDDDRNMASMLQAHRYMPEMFSPMQQHAHHHLQQQQQLKQGDGADAKHSAEGQKNNMSNNNSNSSAMVQHQAVCESPNKRRRRSSVKEEEANSNNASAKSNDKQTEGNNNNNNKINSAPVEDVEMKKMHTHVMQKQQQQQQQQHQVPTRMGSSDSTSSSSNLRMVWEDTSSTSAMGCAPAVSSLMRKYCTPSSGAVSMLDDSLLTCTEDSCTDEATGFATGQNVHMPSKYADTHAPVWGGRDAPFDQQMSLNDHYALTGMCSRVSSNGLGVGDSLGGHTFPGMGVEMWTPMYDATV